MIIMVVIVAVMVHLLDDHRNLYGGLVLMLAWCGDHGELREHSARLSLTARSSTVVDLITGALTEDGTGAPSEASNFMLKV